SVRFFRTLSSAPATGAFARRRPSDRVPASRGPDRQKNGLKLNLTRLPHADPSARPGFALQKRKDQMLNLNRRRALGLMGAATGSLILPRMSFAQGARRSITIAVQKISNNNTLDVWYEQSNVGERVFFPN